ncbi:MAG: hypothetical protein Sv326_1344 (plasmid) [Candidatus Fermentimicrarchaeum limneticum]|uniref:Uncharacterized protein n=1 Tax=Fermentimicrarchaeum limneticum TaxID=2795018 RepID=A0A7D6BD09_FERL1|nr:MAG: hypothetical protein Sv326_1344 [Candidatus Fermentimicrarchaeum limneticum]
MKQKKKTYRVSWVVEFEAYDAKDKDEAIERVRRIVRKLYAMSPLSEDRFLECEEVESLSDILGKTGVKQESRENQRGSSKGVK